MSSDNPFEQVEALIASDERQRLPTTVDAILKAIAKVPGAGPLVAAVRYESEKQRIENKRVDAQDHVGRAETRVGHP